MKDYHAIRLKGSAMKTYLFQVEREQEDDSRWNAWIETLPGCMA